MPAVLIFYLFFKNKIKNNEKNTKNNLEKINSEINNLNNEINLLQKNNNELEKEINNLKNNYILKINLEKEKIKNKYLEKIEKNKINNLINLENINFEIQNLENKIGGKKIELHTLEIDEKNIEPKLENLSKIEERLVYNNEKIVNLKKLEQSINLAKNVITQNYEEMKNLVSPKFTQNLSEAIDKITNGKYNNVRYQDETGLIVELKNGEYTSADTLSIGTIDQLYLSLRLSMAEELSSETMPIFLDESFAYYDTERLKNILQYISDRFKQNQVLIFTCTYREKEILEELKIPYNFSSL